MSQDVPQTPSRVLMLSVDTAEGTECGNQGWVNETKDFVLAKDAIVKRKNNLCAVAGSQLAIAYKSGSPFPL